MKISRIIVLSIMLIAYLANINCEKSNATEPTVQILTNLSGEYLGQIPPGKSPVLFAPGFVSRPDYFEHSAAVFSPDKSEVYWSGKANGARYFRIYSMKMVDGKWGEPQVAFSHSNKNFGSPVFSTDGNKLYFDIDSDICFVEKQGDTWTEPVKVSPAINSGSYERMNSVSENGSIYFKRYNPNEVFGKKGVIYVSRIVNGIYTEPEKLDENINSDDTKEEAVFVAPDESYLILESTRDNINQYLFICYRMKDGSWSERINLYLGYGRFPVVSPDGKYLFYMTHDGIFWVNTSFIEDLKPDELK